ncbi:glycosyltransferase family 2 protein [Litoribaculum gwangyangense]|uniref:Glycosyltransferase family 2 protein n=1 Tax=Litoribaculum gwangyangense TaxID=1130722 RepID=A0ABP9CR94_9FLAO
MRKILDLTIAIPVKNEEKNLLGCLEAIGSDFVKHIVIIDSGSTDKTLDIADSKGVSIVNFVWDGKFPKKRNWFLRNYKLETKWVLFLDADEYLTPEFKKELKETLETQEGKVGFWLNYTIYFMGKKLKGGYPLNKLALFKVGAGEYEKIDEDTWSNLDMEIHEHPILVGEIGYIKSKIDHRDFRGVSHYMTKHNEYASWEAYRFIKTFSDVEAKAKWTWKQKVKYKLIRSPFIGPVYFLGSYFFYGGWKDGATGFAFAILKMSYFTQIYCKIVELNQTKSF